MNTFTNYIKIRVGLCYITGSPEEKDTDAFHDRIYDIEEELRSIIMLPLNEHIGVHNWAIRFVQLTPLSKDFLIDIWAENEEQYARIFYIVGYHLKKYSLIPFYQGPVERLFRHILHEA